MYTLTAIKAGYLRQAPSFEDAPVAAPSASVKSMWRKFHLAGDLFADEARNLFKRTSIGDQALERFDSSLSEPARQVLNAVRAQKPRIIQMKGINTVVAAGLVVIDEDGVCSLTPDGERLADPVGEEGYFEKSGNKVKLISVDERGDFHVERVDGDSAGKGMSIPRESFVRTADWNRMYPED